MWVWGVMDLTFDPRPEPDKDLTMRHSDPEQPNIADLQAQIRLLQAELDLLAPADAALALAERRVAALQTLIERQSARIVELQRTAAECEQQVDQVYRSLSWRITAPLRALSRWLHRPG